MFSALRFALMGDPLNKMTEGGISGINQIVLSCAKALKYRGHAVRLMLPQGSWAPTGFEVIHIPGTLQKSVVGAPRDTYPIQADNVISNYCAHLNDYHREFDMAINFCYDWLPYYLTPFFRIPLLHYPNACNENDVVTHQIQILAKARPYTIGVLSVAQREALGLSSAIRNLRAGIDTTEYQFNKTPLAAREYLAFASRITPVKGLEAAADIAKRSRLPLHVIGHIDDKDYYDAIVAKYDDVIVYKGFLNKPQLAAHMRGARALLTPHTWVEAFGIITIEALACGTPVITYEPGAPKETIQHGVTGFVVKNVMQACQAVKKLNGLKPEDCHKVCEAKFSIPALAKRLDAWIEEYRQHEL